MTPSSRTRPRDWHPLAESDPVPGDPEEIRDEVKHMTGVAASLREQARLLRGIGDDNELKGKYAEKLRSESGTLEKHLREVAGRYERVHGHLTNWADDLEEFQTQADDVLRKAKEKQDEVDAEKAKRESVDGKTSKAPEGGTDDDPLRDFRNRLDRIKKDRDDRARHHTKKIRDQLDDVIEDSWWDDVKGWVHENADWIKVVIDVLGWIATIVGVIAMFIPGLNIAVFLLVAGLLVVGTRMLLVASGDASWMDVAMDSIGLLTMGMGRLGVSLLKGANSASRAAAAVSRVGKLKDGVLSHSRVMDELGRTLATSSDDAVKAFSREMRTFIRKKILDDAGRVFVDPPQLSKLAKAANLGDDEAASLYANIARNGSAFPEAVSSATRVGARAGYGLSVAGAYIGTGADVIDKTFGQSDALAAAHEEFGTPDKPFSETYNDWKANTWMPPVDTHW
ncbi:putative T7SS-secreted protein [Streptomyces sp. NPDC057757]|uniref:putative T7SS-secreted protein n=1 Tax=Streptomyces sp. NPDC057757 TaxID=3346241 RepID=UPI0036930D62